MAIKEEIRGNKTSTRYIKNPGEYKVKISSVSFGHSKAGKPMFTITFQNDWDDCVKGYYLPDNKWHAKSLSNIKIACGLSEDAPTEQLNGKRLGILVKAQEPNEKGRVFMQVVGYAPESSVDEFISQPEDRSEEIPF